MTPATGQLLAYDDGGGCTPYDTWTWDGAAWSQHQQNGVPRRRDYETLGYDGATKQVIMFGGFSAATCPGEAFTGETDETWTWNGSIWSQQHPQVSPSPRDSMCAAFDSDSGQFIAFGGQGNDTNGEPIDLNETWNWTGTTWAQLLPALTPPAGECSMTYDPARKMILMLAAGATTGGNSQTWAWNGTNWSHLADPPAVVNPVGFAFNADTGEDMTYAGQGTCTTLGPMNTQCVQNDQTWTFNGSTWSQAPAANNPGPAPLGRRRTTTRRTSTSSSAASPTSSTASTTRRWSTRRTAHQPPRRPEFSVPIARPLRSRCLHRHSPLPVARLLWCWHVQMISQMRWRADR